MPCLFAINFKWTARTLTTHPPLSYLFTHSTLATLQHVLGGRLRQLRHIARVAVLSLLEVLGFEDHRHAIMHLGHEPVRHGDHHRAGLHRLARRGLPRHVSEA
jgi:hypothetical protein